MSRKLGVSRNPGYKKGSHWAECYSCGYQFRKEELRKTWDNRWVCEVDFETRHPQDFLRVREEKIAAGEPQLRDSGDTAVEVTFLPPTSTVPDPTFGGSGL